MASHRARRQRAQLRKSHVQIEKPFGIRTLKRAARKRIERERAPSLWIFPGDGRRNLAGIRAYPPATLLGLPTELRQNILRMSYSIEDLQDDVAAIHQEDKKRAKRLDWAKAMSPILIDKMGKAMLTKFGLRSQECKLIIALGRKISLLSCISPFIHQEMHYVGKRWHIDLKKYLEHDHLRIHQPKPKVIPAGFEWLFNPGVGPLALPKKKSQVVKLKGRQSKQKVRPWKCWYCTERHFGDDPVCPMARYDPKRWQQMTKEVSGKRGKGGVEPTFRGEKVIFDT
jgi:hypothetical protein